MSIIINKKIKNATPLVYNEIKFRSKLEVSCYKLLLENNIQCEYEKVKYTIVDGFTFNNKKIRPATYTPDFTGNGFVIECKGWANDVFALKWKLFQYYLYKNNINIELFIVRNKRDILSTISKIKENDKTTL